MSTTWTKALEQLQRSAQLFAKVVEEMSGGRFRIEVVQAARKVHASFTRFQALVDPWDRAAEGGSLHLVGV